MVRIGLMASHQTMLDRRTFLAEMGGLTLASAWPAAVSAQGRSMLTARVDRLNLRTDGSATEVWSFQTPTLQLQRGEGDEIEVRNELPAGLFLDWRGFDGTPALEPLLATRATAPGSTSRFRMVARHAGTFLCSLATTGATPAARTLPVIVAEREPIAVDREEILLIEEWRLRSDGSAIEAGADSEKIPPIYTINGKSLFDIDARKFDRLRLRLINGCQRTVIAVKFDAVELRVMAMDGQPAEPFPARNGAVVLPPGGRIDAFVDAAAPSSILLHDGKEARAVGKLALSADAPIRNAPLPPAPPLPSNGLPERLELKGAQRFELGLQGAQWVSPASFTASASPAFRVKPGRVVVLALNNRAGLTTVFHLHGHHFRLLDRLDDGWKPYWLDTLALQPGETQRIAFLAEYGGRYLLESTATDWAAPKLVRWYAVE